MLDFPADVPTLLSLVLAIAAFAFAIRTSNEMARLRRRLEAMEQQLAPPAAISAMPPPIPSRDDELVGASPVAPDQTPEAAAEAITTGAPEHASRPEPAESPPSDTGPMPPPLAPAEPGFEERIGTR